MKFCAACSMPLDSDIVIGLEKNNESFCIHCVNEDKKVKSCEEIFEGGVGETRGQVQCFKTLRKKGWKDDGDGFFATLA